MKSVELIDKIKSNKNEQEFRDWLFCDKDNLPNEIKEASEKCFGILRNEMKNKIGVVDIYEAKNKSYVYHDVVAYDSNFIPNICSIIDTSVYAELLRLILSGILKLYKNLDYEAYYVANNLDINKLGNVKFWDCGNKYQIENKYNYIKGNCLAKDIKLFSFNISDVITNKLLLNYIIVNMEYEKYNLEKN